MAASDPPRQVRRASADRATRERLSVWLLSALVILGTALWIGVIAFLISRLV